MELLALRRSIMKLIQFILVPLLLGLVFTYFRHLRSKLLDRVIVLFLGIASISMVLFPDLTQSIAHSLGVGRGADLVTYFGLVGLAFMSILHYSKIRELEVKITDVTRHEALRKAEPPQSK